MYSSFMLNGTIDFSNKKYKLYTFCKKHEIPISETPISTGVVVIIFCLHVRKWTDIFTSYSQPFHRKLQTPTIEGTFKIPQLKNLSNSTEMAAPQIQITRFAQGRESSRKAFEIIKQLIQLPTITSPETATTEINESYIPHL
jgi:hypothetical protein